MTTGRYVEIKNRTHKGAVKLALRLDCGAKPAYRPDNTLEAAEIWAAEIGNPGYAIGEQTAIKVVDGTVEVIYEGDWRLF